MFKKLIEKLVPQERSEPFQQPEDASELVANRRTKRRIKAALSVTLALGAGAFLSCQRFLGLEEEEKSNPTNEATSQTSSAPPQKQPASEASQPAPSTAPQSASAPMSTELTTTTQPTKEPKHKSKTSTTKHKKGMPVLDNLLE